MADLSPAEREQWALKLTQWQGEISDYGLDGVFDAAQDAILHGWDHPPLQRVLRGEITRQGAWEDEAPWFADELALARLEVLERQGRYQEYLYLAEAEGQMELPFVRAFVANVEHIQVNEGDVRHNIQIRNGQYQGGNGQPKPTVTRHLGVRWP